MTEYILDNVDCVVDFLRTHLVDPRARAEASHTNNLTATAGQTVFTVTPSVGTVSCITAITVNAASKSKWQDYYWDYQNSKITFFTALSLNDAVVITFKQGTSNWIYGDKPENKLSNDSFPRIACFLVSGSGARLGQYESPVQASSMFQCDIWTRNDQVFTINSRKYSNDYLGRYIGGRITKAFEDNESDLFPVLYGYTPASVPRAAPESVEYQAYHTVLEINMKCLDSGRIEK